MGLNVQPDNFSLNTCSAILSNDDWNWSGFVGGAGAGAGAVAAAGFVLFFFAILRGYRDDHILFIVLLNGLFSM